jgi:hypothetical protein
MAASSSIIKIRFMQVTTPIEAHSSDGRAPPFYQ